MKKRFISLLLLIGLYEVLIGLFSITGTPLLAFLTLLFLLAGIVVIIFGYCPPILLKLWDQYPDMSLLLAVVGFFILLFLGCDLAFSLTKNYNEINTIFFMLTNIVLVVGILSILITFLIIVYRNIRESIKQRRLTKN